MTKRGQQLGFTLVEILVTIAVLSILAGVVIISYSGWSKRAATTAITSDLVSAATAMQQTRNFSNRYPRSLDELASSFKPSSHVSLSLSLSGVNDFPVYSNLSSTQNGVLFHSICDELVAEGYGKGTNKGGGTEQYISGCNVYDNDELQVNSAWNGHNLRTPVNSDALPGIVTSINYDDSWRPNRDQVEKDFYQTWHDRYQAMGGSYPVETFWDDWCTGACAWGVQKEPLPTPSSTGHSSGGSFCIQAISQRHSAVVKHIKSDSNEPADGPC